MRSVVIALSFLALTLVGACGNTAQDSIIDENGEIEGVVEYGDGVVDFYDEMFGGRFPENYHAYLNRHPGLEVVQMNSFNSNGDGWDGDDQYRFVFRQSTCNTP